MEGNGLDGIRHSPLDQPGLRPEAQDAVGQGWLLSDVDRPHVELGKCLGIKDVLVGLADVVIFDSGAGLPDGVDMKEVAVQAVEGLDADDPAGINADLKVVGARPEAILEMAEGDKASRSGGVEVLGLHEAHGTRPIENRCFASRNLDGHIRAGAAVKSPESAGQRNQSGLFYHCCSLSHFPQTVKGPFPYKETVRWYLPWKNTQTRKCKNSRISISENTELEGKMARC